jgi:hypothetical protein
MALGVTIRAVVGVNLDLIGDEFGLCLGFILSAIIILMAAPIIARLPGGERPGRSSA